MKKSSDELLGMLPPVPEEDLLDQIRTARKSVEFSVIVLDDDPTGTQTVHGIPVLTQWSESVITDEMVRGTPLFFILTNSRSLPEPEAVVLGEEIGRNIAQAGRKTGKAFMVISRSDSTLRGHYPAEVDALEKGLEQENLVRLIIPAFFDGGRITVDDVHYVKDGDGYLPAAETPYARDTVFGYTHSNLTEWVEEKTSGRTRASTVTSFSLDSLRTQAVASTAQSLANLVPGTTGVVNAVVQRDLQTFVLALLQSGITPLCRTAADFVSTLAALPPKALLGREDLINPEGKGILVVVGSHVPKSTDQLNHLLQHSEAVSLEVTVAPLLDPETRERTVQAWSNQISEVLSTGKTLVLYTQRELVTGQTAEEDLAISRNVSSAICSLVSSLPVAPGLLIAKGGITSSDIATKSLHTKRAEVLGQILPGVPVWKMGPHSRFPGMPYVVFPGNVGEADSITEIIRLFE